MVSKGDSAPDFTVPLAHGDDEVSQFTLSDRLDEEAPVVLAFFPGAFTSVCSHELNTFQERLSAFEEAGASIYGVSVDSPFSLNAFRERLGLEFGLLSDANKELVEDYGVTMDFPDLGLEDFAQRAVFIVDADGEITYAWVADDPRNEPDYDEVEEIATATA